MELSPGKELLLKVVLMGIIGIGGLVYIQKSMRGEVMEKPAVEVKKEEPEVRKIENKEDLTEGLKKYGNYDARFTMKIPDEWFVEQTADESGDIHVNFASLDRREAIRQEIARMGQNYSEPAQDIEVIYSPTVINEKEAQTADAATKTAAKAIDGIIAKDSTLQKIGTMDIGGVSMVEVLSQGEGQSYMVLGIANGHLYKIRFPVRKTKESLSPLEKAILSTFEVQQYSS